jgi:SNF2 family DNA or RNA helicase
MYVAIIFLFLRCKSLLSFKLVQMPTKFFTNNSDRNLFDKFKGITEGMQSLYAFHAVIGYFRSSGYFALQPYLKHLKEVKILVGINVDALFAEAQRKGMLYFGDTEKTKDEFLKWFIQDIKEAKYSKEVEDGILEFINDLIDGRIEIRASDAQIIHAKFYLFLPEEHTEHSDGWIIMGSSNLTEAGLGIKKTPNYELNIALKDYDDVAFGEVEFQKLWQKAVPILPADIQTFKQKTHIGQTFTPYEIYIKFLIEYFGKNIEYDPDTVGDLPPTFKKLTYQVDAVNQGFQMLIDHNGFFLADVVGLGKTVVAAMVAKRFLIANGSQHTKILVVYPPALEKNWKTTFRLFNIDKYCKFITNGRLEKIVEGNDANYWAKEDYDLVLVDEAHRYRNHTSTMFRNLQLICKAERNGSGMIAGKKKRIMLISATPLNNRPEDLYYQLLLFQDARRSTLPETNLQAFFGPKIHKYREIMQQTDPDVEAVRKLYATIREKVIAPVTVRRTRKDLRNYPEYLEDLKAQGIEFPEIADPKAKIYQLDTQLNKLFYRTIFNLTDDAKLKYYRYQAIAYLTDAANGGKYEKAELVSRSLAAIMKTQMVKRLESSFFAFKKTVDNLHNSTKRMIQMFADNKIFIAPDLNINNLIEKGLTMDEIELIVLEDSLTNQKSNVFEITDFHPIFIEALKNDLLILEEIKAAWAAVEQDPKLAAFIDAIDGEFLQKDINPTGKLVIFTESKDTANYLHKKLETETNQKILCVSADNRSKIFDTILENFDANYDPAKQKNDYNIIITTDVLAEGVNLHRANVIINYDTPWNATRLMQRIGRVNRIGSVAGTIHNYCFYPSSQGDDEIKLYKNALIKLQGFHSAFGEDAKIYTHNEIIEDVKLHKEGVGDGGEDKRLQFLQVIRAFRLNNPREFRRIAAFPLKARTGRSNALAQKENATGTTVSFLKSPYKTEFYSIDANKKTTALTFLEAAELFEAQSTEPPFALPTTHYDQVNAALHSFEQDFLNLTADSVSAPDKTDAVSAQARKSLRDFKTITQRSEVKTACDNLIILIENGTFTALPNEMKKVRQQFDKKAMALPQVENAILILAKKYTNTKKDDTATDASTDDVIDFGITPSIVLSITFIP